MKRTKYEEAKEDKKKVFRVLKTKPSVHFSLSQKFVSQNSKSLLSSLRSRERERKTTSRHHHDEHHHDERGGPRTSLSEDDDDNASEE